MAENQDYLGITTPLGNDVLKLIGISGDESISNLFHFALDLSSEDKMLVAQDIVGKSVNFWFLLRDGSKRFCNGFVSQFESGTLRSDGHRSYKAVVVPWLWFLSKTCDHKIFQAKDALQIIEEVFGEYGFTDYKFSVNKICLERDYCVQYGESAFDFVCRLMEEEGIFYYFTHEDGKHTMVLSDNTTGFINCDEDELIYLDNIADEHLHSWSHQYAYITGKVSSNSYSFEEPNIDLNKEIQTVVDLDGADNFEHYKYPYNYIKSADAEGFIKARIEAEESQFHTVEASGTYRSLKVGGKFTIGKHECSEEEGKGYTIIGMRFDTAEDATSNVANMRSYFNQFICIPNDVIPRPKPMTPRPHISGLQTAVVVGPSDEEIYTDEYGRVKIQFHWDRLGVKDENSSCWVRVSQNWAGNNWGGIIIPRIDQEVVVSFLEGNPDKPLITGQVYNATNMPPYELPANQTQSGFKTRSTIDGGTATFNELRFEDEKDSEEIYIHAQKDFNVEINNNKNTTIEEGDDTYLLKLGNVKRTIEEGDDLYVLKKGHVDKTLDEGNYMIGLTKGDFGTVLTEGNQTTTLESGNAELTLNSGNLTTKLDSGESSLEASDKIEHKVGSNSSTIDTSQIEHKVSGNSATIDSSQIELKVGGSSIKIESTGITLKAGSNEIKMDPSGVQIKGLMVKVEGSTMTEVKGSAMVKIQGGVTMIN